MAFLFDGNHENLQLPPISIFAENSYKQYTIKQISARQISQIVSLNSFSYKTEDGNNGTALYPLISFINHNRETNVMAFQPGKTLKLLVAARDIKEGE